MAQKLSKIREFQKRFPDEDACLLLLMRNRFGGKHPRKAAEPGFDGSGAMIYVDGVFLAIDVALCAMASLLF